MDQYSAHSRGDARKAVYALIALGYTLSTDVLQAALTSRTATVRVHGRHVHLATACCRCSVGTATRLCTCGDDPRDHAERGDGRERPASAS